MLLLPRSLVVTVSIMKSSSSASTLISSIGVHNCSLLLFATLSSISTLISSIGVHNCSLLLFVFEVVVGSPPLYLRLRFFCDLNDLFLRLYGFRLIF